MHPLGSSCCRVLLSLSGCAPEVLQRALYVVHLAAHEAILIQLVHWIVLLRWDAAGGTLHKQFYKNKQKLTEPAWFNAGCQSGE